MFDVLNQLVDSGHGWPSKTVAIKYGSAEYLGQFASYRVKMMLHSKKNLLLQNAQESVCNPHRSTKINEKN